jgi:cytoskeletal protein CcmA (bactofilin family)
MKFLRGLTVIFFTVSLFFIGTSNVEAFELRNSEKLTISDTVNSTVYASGSTLNITGTINGDLFCAGQTVTISGTVNGDVICAGQTLNINGVVTGDVRLAGQYITIKGTVQKNATVFSQGLYITKEATMNGDVFNAVQNANIEGKINGEYYGGAEEITIAGTVNKDVSVEVVDLTISRSAVVSGTVRYTSDKKATIDDSNVVRGGIEQKQPKPEERSAKEEDQVFSQAWILKQITSILAFTLTTFLVAFLLPRFTYTVVEKMKSSKGTTFAWGALVMFTTPVIIIFLLLTIIGIGAAFAVGFLWAAGLIISRAFTAVIVGEYILQNYFPKQERTRQMVTLVGSLVTSIVFLIPILGGLASFLAIIWGLGGMALSLYSSQKELIQNTQ